MLRHRTDDLRAFGASDPGGKGKWLGVHGLEAGGFQPGLGPSDRPPMGFGAGQTLSDLGGQRLHEIEGGGIVERSLSEAGRGDDQRIRRLRVGGHRCSSACREGSRNDKNPRYLAHGIAPSPIYCDLDRSVSLGVVFNRNKGDGQGPDCIFEAAYIFSWVCSVMAKWSGIADFL